MKEFKLVRKIVIYEEAFVEAKSKEAALKLYAAGEVEGWEEDDVSASEDEGIVSVRELETYVEYPVRDGKFVKAKVS